MLRHFAALDDLALGLDLLGLATLLLFLVLGLRGGLWWQLVRLLGVIATLAVARALGPDLGAFLQSTFPDLAGRVAHGLGWCLLLLAGWTSVAWIARIAKPASESPTELGMLDRAGGALAGALTGLGLHLSLLFGAAQFAPPDWTPHFTPSKSHAALVALDHVVPGLVEVRAARSLGLPPR